MAHIRADVVIPYRTKLPRDVAVNTFHFQTIGSWDEGDTTTTANALIDLYQQTIGGNTVSAFLSSCVDRTAGASIKFYNLDDPKPRHPFDTKPMGIAAAAWTGSLPLEVALCGSYQAGPMPGQAQARRRGRIFFGPFNPGALASPDATTGFPLPSPALIGRISAGLQQLSSVLNPLASVTWSVHSRVANGWYGVENGWVDNDFDTQRRRGPRATARTTWS